MMNGDVYGRFGSDDDDDDEHDGPGRHISPPEDPWHLIYIALVLAGVGFLLPYNSFTIAVDYFKQRYPESTIVFDISIVYIFVAFGAVLLNNLFVELVPLNIRIIFGYIVSLLMLIFVSFFEIWWPDTFPEHVSYKITLFSVSVVAFGCTVQQSSFYGYTSMLPKRYTQAVMTGESTAGLIISGNRILTKLLLDDQRTNTLIFFVVSIAFVFLCLITHIAVQKTTFIQFYLNLCRTSEDRDDLKRITLEPSEDATLVDIGGGFHGGGSANSSYGGTVTTSDSTATFHSAATLPVCASVDPIDSTAPSYRVEHIIMGRVRGGYTSTYTRSIRLWSAIKRGVIARWQVGRNVWQYMVSIALAYFVTLCLYPGIETEVLSCRLQSWMPVVMMAVFNLFDFIGKVLSSLPYDWTRRQLVGGSLVRILLVPIMMMCAAPRISPIIPGEATPLMVSAMLGISNGVLGSVPMILAPTKVQDDHRELTGNIMTLSYYVGLTLGASVAYGLDDILGEPLPNPCGDKVATTLSYETTTHHFLPQLPSNYSRLFY
ncbi:equilibrative nucleoside transporter 4-like [Penaeus chinensis]|uniref:equilibrative nucleoside transporter 4-like n=1 Tax=Penaeus chinensis TaxID=139456 RepID=UPI001FB635EB|nr:equilibrative nucleoside transporter 4-like [Penaeus chinensis]XP_047472225.1 equilibrative nucleoside transporter 4-like [Penaeus chinensis]